MPVNDLPEHLLDQRVVARTGNLLNQLAKGKRLRDHNHLMFLEQQRVDHAVEVVHGDVFGLGLKHFDQDFEEHGHVGLECALAVLEALSASLLVYSFAFFLLVDLVVNI